jgi:hypothetical protein
MTIVITGLPDNTPEDPYITLAGNINDWDPNEAYVFEEDTSGKTFRLDIYRTADISQLEFLITRGSLERVEADAFGEEISPRAATFGIQDTVYVEVLSWQDLEAAEEDHIMLVVEEIPPETPSGDPIFFVGEINDWFPYQNKLRLEKNSQGNYFIRLPLRAAGTEYKFTRGGWARVESGPFGYDIDNRVLNVEKSNTVKVRIEGWRDLTTEKGGSVLIKITEVPENTPEDEDIYIAGNFNGWDPDDRKWVMQEQPDGIWQIEVPRSGGVMEFKFTRGDWDNVESTADGDEIDNRSYAYREADTIEVKIEGWTDFR